AMILVKPDLFWRTEVNNGPLPNVSRRPELAHRNGWPSACSRGRIYCRRQMECVIGRIFDLTHTADQGHRNCECDKRYTETHSHILLSLFRNFAVLGLFDPNKAPRPLFQRVC